MAILDNIINYVVDSFTEVKQSVSPINVLDTLRYMKPDIKVVVWENDLDKIVYNETEVYRPSRKEILAVDQNQVKLFLEVEKEEAKAKTVVDIQTQLVDLQIQLNKLV